MFLIYDLGDLGVRGLGYIILWSYYSMTKEINEIINLENKNISYEVRFYCDKCDIEIDQDHQDEHKHKRTMSYKEKCQRYGWNPKEDIHV